MGCVGKTELGQLLLYGALLTGNVAPFAPLRVRQQFDAAVDGLRTARSQLLAVSNHAHEVSRRITENSKV